MLNVPSFRFRRGSPEGDGFAKGPLWFVLLHTFLSNKEKYAAGGMTTFTAVRRTDTKEERPERPGDGVPCRGVKQNVLPSFF